MMFCSSFTFISRDDIARIIIHSTSTAYFFSFSNGVVERDLLFTLQLQLVSTYLDMPPSKVENENQFESNLICRSDEHNNEKVNSVNKSTYQQK